MTAEDRGWHSGPWKPSFAFDRQSGTRAFVFFDGAYRTDDPGHFRSYSRSAVLRLLCLRICFPTSAPTFADSDKRSAVFGPHAILQNSAFANRPVHTESSIGPSSAGV